MPFPSAGCQTCKLRRIKCDETLPVCQRCRKSQRTCYGMSAGPGCSVIHLENSYASGVTKRPRGPRSTRIAEPTSTLAVLQLPSTDLKTRAIAYYHNHHLYPVKGVLDLSKAVSDDFLPTCMSKPDSTILNLAGSCMALAVFSRTQRHPPAAVEASLQYQQLLQSTQQALLSLDAETIDTCLIAIFFMSRYEGAVYCPEDDDPKGPFTSASRSLRHHEGAQSILKIWKEHHSHIHPATDVIRHTRRGLIRSALLRNAAVPGWMMEGSLFGEQGLELEYDPIHTRIANLRNRLGTILRADETSTPSSDELNRIAEELNTEAQELDKALQVWKQHFPTTWNYQRHTLPVPHPWPMRDFHSSTVYSYASPAYAAVCCKYFATRMLTNSTRLRILDLLEPNLNASIDKQRSQCLSHMKTMAKDLASSIPFCLERFKVSNTPEASITLNTNEDIKPYLVSLVIWPLSIAASLGNVDWEQRLWFRSELARLGRIVGFGIAECADTPLWPLTKLDF